MCLGVQTSLGSGFSASYIAQGSQFGKIGNYVPVPIITIIDVLTVMPQI
jgi:hypothetical protein